MIETNRHHQTTINVQKQASLIWNVADILRGRLKPHEYGKVILPMTVIKRLHDTLLPTAEKVREEAKKNENLNDIFKHTVLTKASGYSFYNTSPFTFEKLLADPANIKDNFLAYIHGFSENMRDVLDNFKFEAEIADMADHGELFYVIQEFNKKDSYLGPDKVTSTDMGYIFEELVRRFSESYNEEAGSHFTSRDIIYLMTDLLLIEDLDTLSGENVVKTVYDQTMGTSQMLSAMMERIHDFNAKATVETFGQELNPETYAIAKADTMIRGGKPDNMKLGSTLSNDQFSGYEFDYCISNPPFGIDWKKDKDAVENEKASASLHNRFSPGLPKISDGQLLFLLNGLSKLNNKGRMAIIHNGSALFSGNAGGGESEIRRYVIENDFLEAIVQLPNESFYNTGIATYIWILSKKKSPERQGKVQLIDAKDMAEKRRKNIGEKKYDISDACRDMIVKAYGNFKNETYALGEHTVESKIFENTDFGFLRVTVESPSRDEEGEVILKKGKPVADSNLRDTEDIPLSEDVDSYFKREILPFNPDAWLDRKKDKVGYEIPFTRLFYKYQMPESSDVIAQRIKILEERIVASFEKLSGKDVSVDG